ASRSPPSKTTCPPAMRPGGSGTSRKMASAVAVLPQPDSPTRPTVCPRGTSNETPSTARSGPASVANSTTRSRTESRTAGGVATALTKPRYAISSRWRAPSAEERHPDEAEVAREGPPRCGLAGRPEATALEVDPARERRPDGGRKHGQKPGRRHRSR